MHDHLWEAVPRQRNTYFCPVCGEYRRPIEDSIEFVKLATRPYQPPQKGDYVLITVDGKMARMIVTHVYANGSFTVALKVD